MRRRDFLTLLGGVAVAWPHAARAQQPGKTPTIGFLGPNTRSAASEWVAPLVQRLRELGWIDARNVAIEYRWAEGRAERFAEIAAEFVRLKVDVIRSAQDITPAFEGLKERADALYVCTDALANTNRIRINTLALGARLPTMHGSRDYVEAGGLMSYGPNFPDLFRHAADYVDKVLRGTKPGDIPVEQPTRFDFILNVTTAKALGLTLPPSLLARADEVIE
jgi:putative tryptophan/tyrosine transport system substrate-binding protein